jgi:hypothetical protein
MSDKVAPHDFVRLPEGHVLRECDFERNRHGLRRLNLHPDLHSLIGAAGSEIRHGFLLPWLRLPAAEACACTRWH